MYETVTAEKSFLAIGNQTLGFGRRRYGRLSLATAELFVSFKRAYATSCWWRSIVVRT